MMVEKVTKPIRGLDPELYKKAKADAADQAITIGEWFNQAMAYALYAKGACKKGEVKEK